MRDPRDDQEGDRPDAPPGLFFSRRGNWFYDGQRVGHARLEDLLRRAVARAADGGLLVTTGKDALPFLSEDAPLLVTSVVVDDTVTLCLSDGAREPLRSDLFIGPDDRLRVPVRGEAFWALFSRSAAQLLEPFIDEDGALRVGGRTHAIVAVPSADWSAPPRPRPDPRAV